MEKRRFLGSYGITKRNLCLHFDGFIFYQDLKYIKVCAHLGQFQWWHAEALLEDGSLNQWSLFKVYRHTFLSFS